MSTSFLPLDGRIPVREIDSSSWSGSVLSVACRAFAVCCCAVQFLLYSSDSDMDFVICGLDYVTLDYVASGSWSFNVSSGVG